MRRMYSEGQLDQEIKKVIESGQTENAKPIYWHGLDLYKSGTNSVQAHILNNSDTLIDSNDKLFAWAKGTGATNVKLGCNGVIKIGEEYKNCYFIRFNISSGAITSIQIYYFDETNGYANVGGITESTFANYFAHCEDNLNKVN